VLAVAATIGAVIHSASVIRGSRLGSIALFVEICARIVRSGAMRVLALVTLASIVAGLFGGELLDTIGVPGIWFPFGIGVSRTQYVYAIAIPLLAFLIVRTLPSKKNASIGAAWGLTGFVRTRRPRPVTCAGDFSLHAFWQYAVAPGCVGTDRTVALKGLSPLFCCQETS
jgi:hypothetical protein